MSSIFPVVLSQPFSELCVRDHWACFLFYHLLCNIFPRSLNTHLFTHIWILLHSFLMSVLLSPSCLGAILRMSVWRVLSAQPGGTSVPQCGKGWADFLSDAPHLTFKAVTALVQASINNYNNTAQVYGKRQGQDCLCILPQCFSILAPMFCQIFKYT